ncbi:hypothetical protein GMI70_07010 [Eggerthellaceae bacterium zg-893]|nr:hypothetical protein [Eggerthellaceae bacterium zg-893]
MASEMVKAEERGALEVRAQVNQIQHLMKEVLINGEHYGTVPGCGKKPTLLQPGAEKIAYMFHLVPAYDVERMDLGGGHREYEVTCTLTQRDTGEVVGGGMGTCSTMESKYRYRKDYRSGQRTENPDIADTWNTVMKMAKKRAFVDAVKSTTAASDIFTQDIEDLPQAFAEQSPQPASRTAPQRPDPRKALWEKAAALKRRAVDMGTREEAIDAWMKTYVLGADGCPKAMREYDQYDVRRLIEFLEDNIRGHEEIGAHAGDGAAVCEVVEEPPMAPDDIDF